LLYVTSEAVIHGDTLCVFFEIITFILPVFLSSSLNQHFLLHSNNASPRIPPLLIIIYDADFDYETHMCDARTMLWQGVRSSIRLSQCRCCTETTKLVIKHILCISNTKRKCDILWRCSVWYEIHLL